jgi:hypothetical protein
VAMARCMTRWPLMPSTRTLSLTCWVEVLPMSGPPRRTLAGDGSVDEAEPGWRTCSPRCRPIKPEQCARRVCRGAADRGSLSTGHRTRARTPSAPRDGGMFTMTPAGVTGPARPFRAGSTSRRPRPAPIGVDGAGGRGPHHPCHPGGRHRRPDPRADTAAGKDRPGRRRHAGPDRGDAGYRATALTAALTGLNVHLVVRLPAKNVYYRDPVVWPGKLGAPKKLGERIKCADVPNPEPDEELILPDTARYGTVGIACWRHVHPKVHGDRTYFADWDGDLPIIKGNLVRVHVQHLPDGRTPPANLWLWHAGPAVLPIDEVWRASWPASTRSNPSRLERASSG